MAWFISVCGQIIHPVPEMELSLQEALQILVINDFINTILFGALNKKMFSEMLERSLSTLRLFHPLLKAYCAFSIKCWGLLFKTRPRRPGIYFNPVFI